MAELRRLCRLGAGRWVAGTTAPYDGALFEMEHGPYDIRALQEGLQSMLDRRQIAVLERRFPLTALPRRLRRLLPRMHTLLKVAKPLP